MNGVIENMVRQELMLQEVNRRLLTTTPHNNNSNDNSDDIVDNELTQERMMLKHIRNAISKLDMNKLYVISRGLDSRQSQQRMIQDTIPKIVLAFISSIPYLEQVLAISDELYKLVKPHGVEYPNLLRGLNFLKTLRYDLQNKHWLPQKTHDNYYYPAIIASDDPQNTKQQWLEIIDNMLQDLK